MADCGLDTVLALIGGKWKMLILYHLCHASQAVRRASTAAARHKRKDVDTGSPANAGGRLIGAEGLPAGSA